MMTPEETREWAEAQTYETLLRRWRFAPAGDPIFQGDAGEVYSDIMFRKKAADPAGGLAASKRVGWGLSQ